MSRLVLASLASSACFAAAAADCEVRYVACNRANPPSPVEIDPERRLGRRGLQPEDRALPGEEWLRLAPDKQTIEVLKYVDLRTDAALDELRRSNTRHFGQIRRVLVRMREAPLAGPEHWFPAHVQARDLEFSELTVKPAFPPRKLMRFTLDSVRYTVDVPLIPRRPWSPAGPPMRYHMSQ